MKYKIDFKIIVPVFILAIISIISIYSASIYTSKELGNLALKQCFWYAIGFILVILLVRFKNENLYRYTWFLYVIGNILLVGLLVFGKPINNSKCWYIIPGIGSIQPSEFMKLFIMLALADLIHRFRSKYNNPTLMEEFTFILKSLVVIMIPSILTFMQPDTGAVIIYLVIYVFMLFSSGIRIRWFFLAVLMVLLLGGSFLYIYFFKEDLFIRIFGNSIYYRIERVFNWKNGSGLQLENALVAIGSAGLFGHGFRRTPIYFPESSTDFIFAVFTSNFGFLGCVVLIMIIAYFDFNIIRLSKKRTIDTNKYILAGIIGMLLFQQIQNIGMTIGIVPITGITLPFISYGGSSLLSYMIIVGILINISLSKNVRYARK